MNLNEKNLELQVQVWALIGPVIALATVITLYFQGAAHNLVLSLAVLAGTLACWWWKTKGLIAGLIGITALGAYQFMDQIHEEPFWNIGITCAIAMTFLVTALSFEEVEAIVEGIQSESASRLKSLLKLDEKLEYVQAKLQNEKTALQNRIKEREQELHHQGRLIEISRDEIVATHHRHEELLTEIHQLKTQSRIATEQELVENASFEALAEIEELRAEVTRLKDQLYTQQDQSSEEIQTLKQQLIENDTHASEQLARVQAQLQENQESSSSISTKDDRELRKVLGLHRQLRKQFEEKSELLDATRRELFVTQEKLTQELMEQKERQFEGTELEKELQRCLADMEVEQKELIAAHRAEVDQLQELITTLMDTNRAQ